MSREQVDHRYSSSDSPHPHTAFKNYTSIAADVDFTDKDNSEPVPGANPKAFMIKRGTGSFVYTTPEQTSDQTLTNAEDLTGIYMPVELTKIDETTDDSLEVIAFW